MAEPFAQTNLQLYAQLRRAGWPAAEVEAAARAYRLASRLLAGWYRASGKTFVDHFVGTASIVVATGGRPELVRAALLHNAYGSVLGAQVPDRRRREVRAAIGVDAEALVDGYAGFPWDDDAVVALATRAGELTALERDLVVLRLANEIDDRLDLGGPHSCQPLLDLGPMVDLARGMDQPVLAEALARIVDEEAAAVVEPGVRSEERVPYVLTPPSDGRRRRAAAARARRLAARVRRRIRPGGR